MNPRSMTRLAAALVVAAFLFSQPRPATAAATADQGRLIGQPGAVLDQRARVDAVNRMLRQRLDDLLPRLMRESGIDMWLVINREYAEDPVYLTLVPEPVFAARRTTILMFHDRGDVTDDGAVDGTLDSTRVERATVSRYPLGDLYRAVWEGGDLDEQWRRLAELIRERDPETIGVNTSRHWPVADGLTASLRDRLSEALGPELDSRVTSAEKLAIRWLETRGALELEIYPHIVALARGVVSEVFSSRVITPGITTTADVAWAIRQRFADLDLQAWFMPSVNTQRPGVLCDPTNPFCGTSGIIQRGDVIHTDVGVCYLRLCTDTQEMGYILRLGESEVPAGLVQALAIGNRWQDLLTSSFSAGKTGNQILADTRAKSKAEDILGSVYTHPLGFFGHAPGPTIGMWDNQGPTPVRGDWKIYPDTAYAIEGNVIVQVPEWDDHWVRIKLEQDAVFTGDGQAGKQVRYIAGRQTTWHVIP